MNLFSLISLLLKIRKPSENIIEEVKSMNTVSGKSGWRTTEFWLSLVPQIVSVWGAVQGFIPPKIAAIISTTGVAVYTVARTVAKAIADIKTAKASS